MHRSFLEIYNCFVELYSDLLGNNPEFNLSGRGVSTRRIPDPSAGIPDPNSPASAALLLQRGSMSSCENKFLRWTIALAVKNRTLKSMTS